MKQIFAMLCFLFVLPFGAAGSADAPEVTDPAGDNTPPIPISGDIVKVWIDDALTEENQLFFHLEVNEPVTQVTGLFAQHQQFRIDFVRPDGGARYLTMVLGSGGIDDAVPIGPDNTVSCRGGETDGENYADVTVQQAFGAQIESDTRYGCLVPVSFIGTWSEDEYITGLRAAMHQTTRGPVNSGDTIPVTELVTYDETDVGSDYLLPFEAPPVIPEFNETSEDMPFSLNQSMQDLSAIYNYKWTGTNATIHELNGTVSLQNGTTRVNVTDPLGNVVYDETHKGPGNFSLQAAAFNAEEGEWTIQVTHAQANGNLGMILTPDPLPGEGNEEGNGTVSDSLEEHDAPEDDEKESPGFGILGVIGLVAVAVKRRK